MRVKIFRSNGPKVLEEEINEWLEALPEGTTIVSTQTTSATQNTADAPDIGRAVIVITIWYEPA
jgi:hypothetical protein